MRGAVARALVVLGLCSSFLITSLSSRPCVCALILVSLSLVCVCVSSGSLPRAHRGGVRRRGGAVLPRRHPQHLCVRDRVRRRLPQQQQPHLAHVRRLPPRPFPPFFETPFCTVASLLHRSRMPCLHSSWDNRKITSIPSSISLLKDLMTLFVFSLPFSSLLSASNTDAHNAQRARGKQSHLATHRCHELTPRADIHVCLSFPSPHHALPCGVHRARLATDTCATTT